MSGFQRGMGIHIESSLWQDWQTNRQVHAGNGTIIRTVTKADLRKAAEELANIESHDPFELYASPAPQKKELPPPPAARVAPKRKFEPVPVAKPEIVEDPIDFEDPLDEPVQLRTAPRNLPRPEIRRVYLSTNGLGLDRFYQPCPHL